MQDQTETTQAVTSTTVPEQERLDALPRYFGRSMMLVEAAIYDSLSLMSGDYTGGLWQFYELSNGGFYMAPLTDSDFILSVFGNGFEGTVSADAAGIVACLIGYNNVLWRTHEPQLNERFYQLREFALDHPEAGKIFAAID